MIMAPNPPKSSGESAAQSLRAVRKAKLHEQIVSQVRELISAGRLNSGDRLPPERELAEIFNVSRHSVREAIRVMEHQGLVQSRPGSGTFVVVGDATGLVDILAMAIHQEKDKLSEIFELRRLLEPQIAGLAAENASAQDLVQLEQVYQSHLNHLDDQIAAGHGDHAFHLALAAASGNSILIKVVDLLGDLLSQSRAEYSQSVRRRQLSAEGHEEIFRAVAAHDAQMAITAMTRHLMMIEEVVLQKENRTDPPTDDGVPDSQCPVGK